MKLTYDPKHNIAYIYFQKKRTQVETLHVSEACNIDVAPDGTVYGIELLNANKQLKLKQKGKLTVENTETGKTSNLIF